MNTMINMPYDFLMKAIIGIAMVFVIFFQRGNLAWFRVSSAGLLLGLATSSIGIWLAFLVASSLSTSQ